MLTLDKFKNLPQLSDYEKIGPQMGSNHAGVYQHRETGDQVYIKHQRTNDHAVNEVMSSKLYQAAGSPVLDSNLMHLGDGKLGTFTKMEKIRNMDPYSDQDARDIQQHFGTHVWLGNWDAVGLVNDNQARGPDGTMKTLDVGGAMKYRAQGGPKGAAWSNVPSEHHTLKDADMNETAANIFGKMDPEVERESYQRVAQVPDETIKQIVSAHDQDPELADKLIHRKNFIANLAKR